MEQTDLIVSASPHIRSPENVSRIMWTVAATLAPAGLWAWYWFGFAALRVVAFSVIAAMGTELVIQKLMRRTEVTLSDGSAVVTGLLLAYVLPANAPWYVPVVGSFVAISIGKQAFGGLGYNIWNPALVGRAFVQFAYPQAVSLSQWPTHPDGATHASPLMRKIAEGAGAGGWNLGDLFLGRVPGCIGEVSALLLLLGGLFLIWRGYVRWQMPASYLITAYVLTIILPSKAGMMPFTGTVAESGRTAYQMFGEGLYHVFAGGLIIGAFFMASDMVTTPLTIKGQIIFGAGAGLLTILIRLYGGYPEGVCYSILLMNTAVPIIDRYTKPRKYGFVKKQE
ncbi:MAG: RnfABCDGE type electron transport complex subunit D [Planctomycetes bacterium]|nr:RnfABCDGE type electron transport complex subunit D [Planctomycetota bacterium]